MKKGAILAGMMVVCLIASLIAGCAPAGKATLASISVAPASARIKVGEAIQYRATATYSDGSTEPVTTEVTWSSSDSAVATISAQGLARAKAPGKATITATLEGKSALATLVVTRPMVTIVDEAGRYVEVPCPTQRIASLNSYAAEVLYALGAGDRIVARSKYCVFPPAVKEKVNLGSSTSPNMEILLEQRPDVVIANLWLKQELRETIEKAGIPVVLFNAWKIDPLRLMVKDLGLMLDERARAEELLGFIDRYLDLIKARTKKLKVEEKPLVFYESFKPYSTVSSGTASHDLITLAGGINVAAGEPIRYPVVSAEWVLERNPEIIVHSASSKELGYKATPTAEDMRAIRSEVMTRKGLSLVRAVKDGKVYVINMKVTTGPRVVVGLTYYAKWFHPDLFQDIDPTAIHKELLERFYGLKLEGVFGYPRPWKGEK